MTLQQGRPAAYALLTLVLLVPVLSGCLGTGTGPQADGRGQDEGGPGAGPSDGNGAGSTSPPGQAGPGNGTNGTRDPNPAREVFAFNGSISRDAWPANIGDGWNVHPFTVRANATAIQATLWWNGTLTDLDAALLSPKYCDYSPLSVDVYRCIVQRKGLKQSGEGWFVDNGGTPATPDSPSQLSLGGEAIGEYTCDDPPCEWSAITDYKTAKDATYHYRVVVSYRTNAGGS